jgi:outer membrane protein assembly factor BamB
MICILMFTTFFSAEVVKDNSEQIIKRGEVRNDDQENNDDFTNALTVDSNENVYGIGLSPSGTGGLADSPWPIFRQNLNHTGLSPFDTSSNAGKLRWNFTTGAYIYSPPSIGYDGTIYVGSYDNKLYAINSDGTEKWSFITADGIGSSPTIGSDGTIYIGSYDDKLYAIHPNGTEKWNFKTNNDIRSSPAIGSDGTIYIGSQDEKIYAINPNGTEKWNFTTGDSVHSSPAIDSYGTIYIGSLDNKLYAINSDGTEKWNFTTGSSVWSSPAIGSNGIIYVGSDDNKLYAINQYGTEEWSFMTNNDVFSSPAIGLDGTIYVGSNDGKLYAINSNGTQRWNFTAGDWVISSPAIGSDGTIYIGSGDNNIYAINSDGTEKWKYSTGNSIISSPAIGSDGTIYIGSRDNKLHAIGKRDIPPIAVASSEQTVNEGIIVQFNASSSHDPDGTIETYEWDFDASDGLWWETGAPADATGPTATHTYGDDGVYIATLRVTDDTGLNGTDICNITVNNVAPTINPFGPFIINEGSYIIFDSNVTDPGSDDLTFNYDWGDETSPISIVYYNNGIGPEPIYDPGINEIKSPGGNHPFDVSNIQQHTYGDNGVYLVTLTVEDDDGGASFYNTTIVVNNIAPIVTLVMTPFAEEGSQLTFEANASDPGSDDLTFSWQFEYGPTIENTYYNDGVGPEPVYDPGTNEIKSPEGTFAFNVSDILTHTYGDNYDYFLALTVTDDDGGKTEINTTIAVDNIAPSITKFAIPLGIFEGSKVTFQAAAKDLGSDDLTFLWEFEQGPSITNVYYNDGTNPDPYPSPLGNFPFNASDVVEHIYGDNGEFYVMLTVIDDDNGTTTFNTTVTVNNVAPKVDALEDVTIDEGGTVTFIGHAKDPGSDDLTFTWNWEYAPWGGKTTMYYNDGIGPDPYPSPTINPRDIIEDAICQFGDDGVFTVTLTVTDDDNASTVVTTNVTVNNITPTVTIESAVMDVEIGLRVAGRKYNDVGMTLFENGNPVGNVSIERRPGSPNEQMAWISVTLDMTKTYCAIVIFTPEDPPDIGGNPVWLYIKFENDTEERIHHTFNVQQSKKRDSGHWNHVEPWEVDLNGYLVGHAFEITSHITDPGSDDEILTLTYGSQTATVIYLNDPPNPDPYPSPEINPKVIIDITTLIYEGRGTITLVVKDDDNIRFGVGQGSDSIILT